MERYFEHTCVPAINRGSPTLKLCPFGTTSTFSNRFNPTMLIVLQRRFRRCQGRRRVVYVALKLNEFPHRASISSFCFRSWRINLTIRHTHMSEKTIKFKCPSSRSSSPVFLTLIVLFCTNSYTYLHPRRIGLFLD